jgi:uncharacterized membrane protein (UPF0127 family)
MRLLVLCCTIAIFMVSCSKQEEADRFMSRAVTMPNGDKVYAEMAIEYSEILRGLMFRDSLAKDRGMLFIHNKMGRYSYWMFQVKIPLDIVWMDKSKTVVEVLANVPPCPSAKSGDCPQHGGTTDSQFVLELAAGMAAKYGVTVGSKIDF